MVEDFVEESCYSNDGLFDCDFTSIDEVINEIKVFTGAVQRETENGLRTLIAYQNDDGSRSAFWTDSKNLKSVTLNPNRTFPFRAIIKVVVMGKMCGFKFFAPSSAVTDQDVANFNFYRKSKYRNNKGR